MSKTIPSYQYLWEEIINDTLLDVWENINSFDNTRSSFKNWCGVISKYNAISGLRKELRHYSIPLEDSDGFYHIEDMKDLEGFKNMISLLSKEDQVIFINFFFEEIDYDEISKITGLNKKVIYNRVSRGKKKLISHFLRLET